MEEYGTSLAWIFFSTTTFVVLSLIYEGIRWAYKHFSKKKTQDDIQPSPKD